MYTANFPRSAIVETYGEIPFPIGQNDWLISIANKDALNANPKKPFGRVLFLNFNDVDLTTGAKGETEKSKEVLGSLGAITDAQADQIAEFICDAREAKANVIVNCHAGICRSGAVVRVLGELGWEIRDNYSPKRMPNMLVYNKLRKRFNELAQSWDM
jgi:predicted protein tyrosine phosphatase